MSATTTSLIPAKLVAGYHRFRQKYCASTNGLLTSLARKGQKPEALVIACSDSRVDPAIVLDCDPGDLFMVRNIANLVPPYRADDKHHGTSAALEFAVKTLQVGHVIIFGHSQCGGIEALLTSEAQQSPYDFLGEWINIADQAKQQTLQKCASENMVEKINLCSRISLQISLENLLTFPWIKKAVEEGKLQLHAWYFNIQEGEILCFDVASRSFKPLV